MSDERKDGGPAFPTSYYESEHGDRVWATGGIPGMSLRDYFAGQALAQASREIWAEHRFEDVAARAYRFADAMIKQRNS